MIILHGFAMSNYFNMVKHALMLKDCDFSENKLYPQVPELLALTAIGKIPAITTASGHHLSETSVILDYIEEVCPQPSLYPKTAEGRAQTRQLIKVIELYLELPSRRLMGDFFARRKPEDALAAEVLKSFQKGCDVINQLTDIQPYLLGKDLTFADIFMRYALAIPSMLSPRLLDFDPVSAISGLDEWQKMMANSDIARKIDADQLENQPEFMAKMSG